MDDIKVGTIVKIKQLPTTTDLVDGQYGLVYGVFDVTDKDSTNSDYLVSLFSSQLPYKEVRVKPECLEPIGDDPEWKIPRYGLSTLELCGREPIKDMHQCHLFAEAVWNLHCAEIPPSKCLTQESMDLIKESKGRKLYWIGMDAIAQHLILERCHDNWRIYQSYILNSEGGYTGGEWCLLQKSNHPNSEFSLFSLVAKPIWKVWGGGRYLTDKDVEELFNIIVMWQNLVKKTLNNELLPQFSNHIDEEVLDHMINASPSDVPVKMFREIEKAVTKLMDWSMEHLSIPDYPGVTIFHGNPSDEEYERMDTLYPVLNSKGEELFKIKSSTLQMAKLLTEKLTGEEGSPAIFLMMIACGVWWQHRTNPRDGSAIGFYVRSCDLDNEEFNNKGKQTDTNGHVDDKESKSGPDQNKENEHLEPKDSTEDPQHTNENGCSDQKEKAEKTKKKQRVKPKTNRKKNKFKKL